jgi:hypothetical protein
MLQRRGSRIYGGKLKRGSDQNVRGYDTPKGDRLS